MGCGITHLRPLLLQFRLCFRGHHALLTVEIARLSRPELPVEPVDATVCWYGEEGNGRMALRSTENNSLGAASSRTGACKSSWLEVKWKK